jgi:hypothetical protein
MFTKHKAILLGALITLILSACTGEADLIQINQQRGREIAGAIEAYEEAHGRLPDRLEALAPTYLAEIPKTVKGQDFDYTLSEEAGYHLSFEVEENLKCNFDPHFEMWECQ